MEAVAQRIGFARMLLWGVWGIFCVVPSSLWAQVLTLDRPPTGEKIGRYLEVLKPSLNPSDLSSVQKFYAEGAFERSPKDTISLGYRGQGSVWARISLQNPHRENQKLWLISRYSSIDYLQLYQEHAGEVSAPQIQGDQVPIHTRALPHRLPVFALELKPGLTILYLRLETTSAFLFDLELWEPQLFVPHELQQTTIVGFLFGICVIMLFYNFFVYLKFNDRSYLYYSLYIASYVTFSAWYHGLAQLYLFPELGSHWLFRGFIFHLVDAITLTAIAFSMEFLQLRQNFPKTYRMLRLVQALSLCSIGLALTGLWQSTALTLVLNFWTSLSLIAVGALASLRFRPARYYTLGWFFLNVGNMVHMAANQGLLVGNTFTFWAQFAGAALELLLLSLALGERVALLNQEREESLRQQKQLQEEALHLEKAAREANEKALIEQRRLNEQRDQLVANTSHELRTPLNGMMGLAQAILRREADQLSTASTQSLHGILQSGQRLAALIGDLLDFSQGQRSEMQLYRGAVSLREQLDFVLMILGATIEHQKLEIKNHVRADLPRVHGDPERIQQIFFNLLGNALKFTEAGSITLSASLQGEQMIIRVKDTGVGIEEEAQKKIFEAFTQANGGIARRYGGTGLGLAIVRELVLAHGGEVGVQSIPGFGSTFWFSLPLAKGEEEMSAGPSDRLEAKLVTLQAQLEAGAQSPMVPTSLPSPIASGSLPSPTGSPLDILVVDDELMNRRVLSELLGLLGHRVHSLGRGTEVLPWITEHGKPDLLLLDIMMPEMSGYEVLTQLRSRYHEAELPILILSAKALEKDLIQGFALGANDYILKPFSAAEIESRITHQARLKAAIEATRQSYQENKELKHALDQVEDELLHAERLAMVGAATAGIAHEIGNPLFHLKTLVAWLIQDLAELEKAPQGDEVLSRKMQKHLELSQRAVETLLSISQALRVVSRRDSDEESWVDPRGVTDDVQAILHHKLKAFQLEVLIEEGLMLKGRRSEFIQLLCNLLGNAADALEEAKADRISLRMFRQGDKIHILVEDGGKGIPAHLTEKIFEPFFTTKRSGQGTGLGLAVVRTLTKKWQAELQVGRSQTLGGASFDISLPVAS